MNQGIFLFIGENDLFDAQGDELPALLAQALEEFHLPLVTRPQGCRVKSFALPHNFFNLFKQLFHFTNFGQN